MREQWKESKSERQHSFFAEPDDTHNAAGKGAFISGDGNADSAYGPPTDRTGFELEFDMRLAL